jgi:hypothetical protein
MFCTSPKLLIIFWSKLSGIGNHSARIGVRPHLLGGHTDRDGAHGGSEWAQPCRKHGASGAWAPHKHGNAHGHRLYQYGPPTNGVSPRFGPNGFLSRTTLIKKLLAVSDLYKTLEFSLCLISQEVYIHTKYLVSWLFTVCPNYICDEILMEFWKTAIGTIISVLKIKTYPAPLLPIYLCCA